MYLGTMTVAGFFTNAPTVPQCTTTHDKQGTRMDCNAPVLRLQPGQVLVTVGGAYLIPPNASLTTNDVVGGRPAAIATNVSDRSTCPAGTNRQDVLTVPMHRVAPANPASQWRLFVTACMDIGGGMPNQSLSDSVETMLRTVSFGVPRAG